MLSHFLRISTVLAFSRGRAETIQIRYVWTLMFMENVEKIPTSQGRSYLYANTQLRT